MPEAVDVGGGGGWVNVVNVLIKKRLNVCQARSIAINMLLAANWLAMRLTRARAPFFFFVCLIFVFFFARLERSRDAPARRPLAERRRRGRSHEEIQRKKKNQTIISTSPVAISFGFLFLCVCVCVPFFSFWKWKKKKPALSSVISRVLRLFFDPIYLVLPGLTIFFYEILMRSFFLSAGSHLVLFVGRIGKKKSGWKEVDGVIS